MYTLKNSTGIEIEFQIAAVRETFEETGILLMESDANLKNIDSNIQLKWRHEVGSLNSLLNNFIDYLFK